MRNTGTYYFLLIFAIGSFVLSCDEVPDCKQESSYASFKVRLFDKDLLTEEKVKFDSIKAVVSDSLFFTSSDSLSLYALDLNTSTTNSTWLFYKGIEIDSLTINYDKAVSLPFEECGPIVTVSNITVSKSTFDSTVLLFDFLDISILENIEIYQ